MRTRFRVFRNIVDPPLAYCGAHFDEEEAALLTKLSWSQEITVRKANSRPTQAKCTKAGCQSDALYTIGRVTLQKVPIAEKS